MKRGREGACVYPPPPVRSKPANVKGRIRQLEDLVVDLMNQQKKGSSISEATISSTERSGSIASETARQAPFTEPTPPSDYDTGTHVGNDMQSANSPDSGVEKPFGHMSISKNEISYHAPSHWQTILSSISDLKNELGDDDDIDDHGAGDDATTVNSDRSKTLPEHQTQPRANTELGFLVGNPIHVTKDDLIKAMPEKKVADRLLSLWFNSPDPLKPIIHAPTYQDEYKQYWKDPTAATVSWLGLTFAILSLAESFTLRDADPRSAPAKACLVRVEKLHSMSASATVLADFTTPKKYTLECLIFYTAGLRSSDGFMKVWLMIGLVLRLSLRMGYHRDPKFYPNISAFDGEMRRRLWTGVSMVDILISFQLGLPSMVRTIITDTEPPRNLLDRDFNPSMKELPPGRSVDELTPSSYVRTKVGIIRIFAEAADLAHSTVPVKHEEVMRLDEQLESACTNMPSLLKMPEMSEIVTDPPEQLMCRINLALLILKTRIILHRNFMLVPLEQLSNDEQLQGIGTSRKICTESALSVLHLQHSIHAESQPGGKLHTVKWYMGSISTHDFLLAAMVVCLALSIQISDDDDLRLAGSQLWCPRRQAMIDALEKSHRIWVSGSTQPRTDPDYASSADNVFTQSSMSNETDKAGKAMGVMLDRVRKHFAGRAESGGPCGGQTDPIPLLQPARALGNSYLPFQGVVSNAPWSGRTSTNEQNFEGDVGANSSFYDSQSAATASTLNENSSTMQGTVGTDFSAIGDQIDGLMPMDWEFWDDQIMQQNAQQANSWDTADCGALPTNANMLNETSSNQAFVAGNAIVPNGTAPILQNDTSELQFNWQDLQDVDLDIRDYGTGGLWGASPGWQN